MQPVNGNVDAVLNLCWWISLVFHGMIVNFVFPALHLWPCYCVPFSLRPCCMHALALERHSSVIDMASAIETVHYYKKSSLWVEIVWLGPRPPLGKGETSLYVACMVPHPCGTICECIIRPVASHLIDFWMSLLR